MPKPNYDRKFNLRLPDELYKKVEKLGGAYDRSMNEQMVYMLRTWKDPSAIEDRLARLEETVFPAGEQNNQMAG
jgi:hypothetical protein